MAFDGIVMKALARGLNETLANGKIEKIYQPDSDRLILHIHAKGERRKLCISCSSSAAAVYLTENNFENPAAPPTFCMLLRKHLGGSRITAIRQVQSERILEIDVRTVDEIGMDAHKRLVIEIMGKHSNIVLIDCTTEKIVDSIKRVSIDVNRVRQLLPGKLYEYPPSQGKTDFDDLTQADCHTIVAVGRANLAKLFLSSVMGISPAVAENLAQLCENKSDDEAARDAFALVCAMREAIAAGSYEPAVYLSKDNVPVDFHIFPLHAYEGYYKKLTFPSVSEMTEYYFLHKVGAGIAKQKSTDLEKTVRTALQKLYLKKQRLCEDIATAENSEELRLFGELLTANIHNIKPGAREVTLTNYYDGQEVKIPLDIRHTPAKNAQTYFKKYGKAHTAVKEKTLRLEEAEQEIAYLESVTSFIENATATEELEEIRAELIDSGYLRRRKNTPPTKNKKPTPYEYSTSSGLRILAGRNNKENDFLTFKSASSRDIWFHTKDIPGSHVILFTEGKALDDLSEDDIFTAAAVAAKHSKGKNSENVAVDYVPVKYVKKPNGAKPGMVIFTNNRTVWVNPRTD